MNMKISKGGKRNVACAISANNTSTTGHAEAVAYIESAIAALGSAAKNNDDIAKESIANLAVILLDLKSN